MKKFQIVENSPQNYLKLYIFRTGVAANMTMDEFAKATEKDGFQTIKVKKHKTYLKHGPAHVTLRSNIYGHLKIYVENLRPTFAKRDSSHVFLSSNGRQMTSGDVSKRIDNIWKSSGVYGENPPPKKNVTGNIIRKSMTTLVHESSEDNQAVADLLAHRLGTAEKIYRVKKMGQQARAGATAIENVTRRNQSTDKSAG